MVLAGPVTILLPPGQEPAAAKAGSVLARIESRTVRFDDLGPQAQNVEITTQAGLTLIGVNMGWYRAHPPAGEPLSPDDRKEIEQILSVPSFYNKLKILLLSGNNQHVTALVELVRDREFHAGGQEIIWRTELWYFEFQNGGWAKVSQENKPLDRQRFPDGEAFEKYVRARRWVPKLGAVDGKVAQITLDDADFVKSSQ
jgi:hypothetical protein